MTALRAEAITAPEGTPPSGNISKLVPASTVALETRAKALGQRMERHQRDGREIGVELLEIEAMWRSATASNDRGFERWFTALTGIARGSIWRYRDIGLAVRAELHVETTPEDRSSLQSPMVAPSDNELAAAGRALRGGASKDQVKASIRSGTTRDLARAVETGGLVQLEVTLADKPVALELARRMTDAYAEVTGGETIAAHEALEYLHGAADRLLSQDVLVAYLRANGEHESLEAAWVAGPTARLRQLETRRAISDRVVLAASNLLQELAVICADSGRRCDVTDEAEQFIAQELMRRFMGAEFDAVCQAAVSGDSSALDKAIRALLAKSQAIEQQAKQVFEAMERIEFDEVDE